VIWETEEGKTSLTVWLFEKATKIHCKMQNEKCKFQGDMSVILKFAI